MRSFLLAWLLLVFCTSLQAGVVKGRVTGPDGEGLPYANIFVRGTTTGTATNDQGYYQLNLPAGGYILVFQYVGYRAQNRSIEVSDAPTELYITLEPEAFALDEVEVRPGGKDPAYAIMQEAIRKRKYHLQEIAAYSCRVYIKGMQRLTKVPGSVIGFKVRDLKPGIAYLSESVSELRFQQPDRYHEKVLSSKVSGSTKTFTFNQAAGLTLNFYQNLLKAEGLHERGFVSPLASNAMLFYRYQLVGDFDDNGTHVYKIKVTPIRKNDPAFRGHIYITDETYRLHSLQLMLTQAAQIEFIDTLNISQTFAPLPNGLWVLTTQKFTFNLDTYGFKGNGYFTAVYSNYNAKPAFATPPPVAALPPEPVQKAPETQPKPEKKPARAPKPPRPKKLPKDPDPLMAQLPKNEVLSIERDANKRDSSYWENIRPIPLTEEEAADYHTKDSLQVITESEAYLDSTDRKANRVTPGDLFLSGYSYRNSFRKLHFNAEPLTRIWQYNTVEGVVGNLRLSCVRSYDDYRRWEVRPEVRYGFSSERLYARLGTGYYFNPRKFSTVWLEGGKFVQQFNPGETITPLMNTIYTLLLERNYMKLYEKQYVRLSHRSEITNGIRLTSSLEYADRQILHNHTDFTLNDLPTRSYSSNTPDNAETEDISFPRNQALIFGAEARIRFGQKYLNRPDEKIIIDTKWPQLVLAYRTAFRALGTDSRFDRLSVRLDDEMALGLFGTTNWEVTGSAFVNNKQVYFTEFQHFITNRTVLARRNFDGFQLLPYYRYSTRRHYVEGHLTHHFNGFWFNKIPLFRRLKWQEVASLHYLYTPALGNYAELGIGIEHIFKLGRVDFYTAYMEGEKASTGVRVGIGF